jgi:DNA-binding CsgD family transcriptional regulator
VSAQGEPFQAPAEHFFVLGKSDHEQPLQIMMRPVAAARAGEGHLVGLILSEPCVAPILPAQVLGELFGLSQAEARLAAALCRGVTPGEYARERGVAIGTVRFQLKQVLAKTHTHRQGNLIQQLCSSVIAQSLLRAGRKTVAS